MTQSREVISYQLTPEQTAHIERFPLGSKWRTAIWREQRITGPLNVQRLLSAVSRVVGQHEALRLGLSSSTLPLSQWVRDEPPAGRLITAKNIASRSVEQFYNYVDRLLAAEISKDWDLVSDYPFRFILLRHSPSLHILFSGFAHVFIDAKSADLIQSEIWDRYGEVPRRYNSRSYVERLLPSSEGTPSRAVMAEREREWVDRFSGMPSLGKSVNVDAQPDSPTIQGPGREHFRISGEDLWRLRRMIEGAACTEFQWILACLSVALFKFSTYNQVKISATIDLRDVRNRETVGMFALRIPVALERKGSFQETLKCVAQEILKSLAAYRRMDPGALDQALKEVSIESAGTVGELTINHRFSASAQSASLGDIEVSYYESPEARKGSYIPNGMDVKLASGPEYIECHLTANGNVIPSALRVRISDAFASALRGNTGELEVAPYRA
ncbi:condensation domain-containing protein [Streptomyces sp. NPDC092903]|uniref:condensation domain-containing protein n=1 Tax=Streptomyces sp. NPDC092903 TaxID=3366017 RepID=UPI00382E55B4